MTTPASATDQAGDPHRARARPPVGPLRALRLRRMGRRDGAAASPVVPDPPQPVTSDGRSQLLAAFFAEVADLWETFFVAHAHRQARLAELRSELVNAHAEQRFAEQDIARVGAVPSPGTVRAGPGELAHERPPELVLRRRTREHARETAVAHGRVESARTRIAGTEREIARLTEQDTEHQHVTAVREHRAMTRFVAERALYDAALVRRHPDGTQLAPLLDRTPPPLTAWAEAGLDAAERPDPARSDPGRHSRGDGRREQA
jgi:hypothetical protein